MSPQNNIRNIAPYEKQQKTNAPIAYDTPPRWDVLNLFLDLRVPSREDFGRALIAVENALTPIESLVRRRGVSLPIENRALRDHIAGLERSKRIWSTVTLGSFFALAVGAIQTGIELGSGGAGLVVTIGTVVGSIFTGYISWGIARTHGDRVMALLNANSPTNPLSESDSHACDSTKNQSIALDSGLEAEPPAIAAIYESEKALLAEILVEQAPTRADYLKWSQRYEELVQRLYRILAKVQHRLESPSIALLAETRLPGTVAPMEEIANQLEEGSKRAEQFRRWANELEELANQHD